MTDGFPSPDPKNVTIEISNSQSKAADGSPLIQASEFIRAMQTPEASPDLPAAFCSWASSFLGRNAILLEIPCGSSLNPMEFHSKSVSFYKAGDEELCAEIFPQVTSAVSLEFTIPIENKDLKPNFFVPLNTPSETLPAHFPKEVSYRCARFHLPRTEGMKMLLAERVPFSSADIALLELVSGSFALAIRSAYTIDACRESEKRFAEIAKVSLDWIWDVDAETKFLFVSHTVEQILGYEPHELLGKTPFDFMVAEEAERVRNIISGYISERKTFTRIENQMVCKDGTMITIESSGTPIYKNEVYCGCRGLCRNITEKKRAEEESLQLAESLRVSEERFRTVLANSDIVVAVFDENLRYQWIFNPPVDLTPTAFIGKRDDQISALVNVEPLMQLKRQAVVDRSFQRDKLEVRVYDLLFILDVAIEPIIDQSGDIRAYSMIAIDITKEWEAEYALRESEERFRELVEISPSGIIIHSDWKVVYANTRAAEIIGEAYPENLIDRDVLSFVHPMHHEAVKTRIVQGYNGANSTTAMDEIFIRANGDPVHVEVSSVPIQYFEKKALQVVFTDISIRKHYEEEIIAARERAEESARMKSTLLENMSHEFRTPLNGILGFGHLLLDELEDETQKEMVQSIIHSGKRLSDTLKSILDFSELVSNRMYTEFELVDVCEVTESVCGRFQADASEKHLYLNRNFSEEGLLVQLDPNLIRQVLQHLLDNAIKYTANGGVTVRIFCESSNESRDAVIEIQDTGIGIEHQNLGIIFEEFRQVSEGISRQFEGKGLGLTISRRMAELMNGELSVESEPGKGSCFRLRFKAEMTGDELTSHMLNSSQLESSQGSIPEGHSILVVEDNILNAEVIKFYLEDIANCTIAMNSEAAFKEAKKRTFDLILMDIHLGSGLSGVDVMNELRTYPGYENIPIAAVTGYAMSHDKDRLLNLGLDYYLAKPFSRDQLRDFIVEIYKNA